MEKVHLLALYPSTLEKEICIRTGTVLCLRSSPQQGFPQISSKMGIQQARWTNQSEVRMCQHPNCLVTSFVRWGVRIYPCMYYTWSTYVSKCFNPTRQSEAEQTDYVKMKNKFSKCAAEYWCIHMPAQQPSAGILSVLGDGLVKTWTENRTGHTGKKLQGPLQSNGHFSCFPTLQ